MKTYTSKTELAKRQNTLKIIIAVGIGAIVFNIGVLSLVTKDLQNNSLSYKINDLKANSAQAAVGDKSLQFNGTSQYARIKDLPLLTTYTYEAWVKRTRDSGTYESVISDANSSYSNVMFGLFIDGGNNDCSGASDQFAYYQSNGSNIQCSGVSADLNTWHHIAMTRASNGQRNIFVDGRLVSSNSSTTAPTNSTGMLTFGRAGSYIGEYFGGLIDEVRISNTVRYSSAFTPSRTPFNSDGNTQGLWHFDDEITQVVSDSSSAARHGTLGSSSNPETADATRSQDTPLTTSQTTPAPTASPTNPPGSTSVPTQAPTTPPQSTPIPTIAPTATPTTGPVSGFDKAIRLFGNGTGDIDRVKIKVDNPQTTADVGATDFTIEWWMKANAGENVPSSSCSSGKDGWITGNIMFDRDIWGDGDYGDFGISLFNGKLAFGVDNGSNGTNLCGTRTVADNTWHHVAVTRQRSNGMMQIFVDGTLDRSVDGPDGDISYRNGRSGQTNDPYLIIGAEKHDYDRKEYPSYSGHIDEVRISGNIRYSGNFSRPITPFSPDSNTLVLYHFNEGSGTTAIDSSGNSTNGQIKYGGNPYGPVFVTSMQ